MKKDAKSKGDGPSTRIADPRFASFETDPRFRLPSKKKTKTTIDKRFSRMFKDDEFTAATRVDRYGRKIKSDAKKKALQRLYQVEDEDEDEEEEDDKNADEGSANRQKDEEQNEVEDDDVVQRELLAAHEKYDPARGGGFSSSESDSDSDSDSDDEEDGGVEVAIGGELQRLQDEQVEVEAGEVTNRIAIVNLDWDHVKSTDLFALFSSFLPTDGGKIEKVSVYPSEFGKERMRQEEVEGPPKALFKGKKKKKQEESDSDDSSDSSDSDDSEDGDEKIKKQLMQEGNDEDFDSDALRAYQLDRLRYYYAVMVCSSPATAKKLYDSTDGTEFQSSSNFLDLRFVPDDVTFDDEPRDECDSLPTSYRPIDFVTNALQSSKVKLTWDMHPEETSRKDSIKRAFTGSRQQLEENDLRAYLASDSEDDGSDDDDNNGVSGEDAPKLSKKELARKRMREALGLTDEAASKAPNKGHVGDMEITFTPALTESKQPKADDKEETTIEKYKRKERERKEKKRQKARAKREGLDPDALDEEEKEVVVEKGPIDQEEDLGFDDPFFTTADDPAPKSKSALRKEERLKKRQARDAAEAEASEQKAHLSKVMAEDLNEDQAEHLDHFDMNDIVRAEKLKGKKGKAKKRAAAKEDGGKLQEGFVMDVNDERFKAVFENHEFAIDPSNPKFKPTEGMKRLLEETRKRRRGGDPAEERVSSKKSKKASK
jgi:hypothetical protein